MIDDKFAANVQKAVQSNFSDQTDLLNKLVSTKSDNPDSVNGSSAKDPIEAQMAVVLTEHIKKMKLKPELVGSVKNRKNVVCRVGPGRARKSLILHACMDTNSLDGRYKGDPLAPFIRGERMYGWGIWNMKASISAYLYAVQALFDMGYTPAGRLLLTFVVDGIAGLGSRMGTKHLLQRGYKAKAAILGSPGPTIGTGHRGGYRFKLTTMGESVHTGSMVWQSREKGKNAIEAMASAIEVLKNTEIPFKHAKAFPGKKPVFTFPTMISGGSSVNRVPDMCEAYGDVRLMPGNSHKQVRMRIEEKLDSVEGLKYDLEDVLYIPAAEVDVKDEVVLSMVEAYSEVTGESPSLEGIGPWNNGWVFTKRDIPAIVQVPLLGGVSRWGLEWVSMPSLKRLTQMITLSIVSYLGIKDIN